MTRQEAVEAVERIEKSLTDLAQIDYAKVFEADLRMHEKDIVFLASEAATVYLEMKQR
jgi:hypothetical protein